MPEITVLSPKEEESWNGFARRILETEGTVVAIISGGEQALFPEPGDRESFLEEVGKIRSRLRLATKQKDLVAGARRLGIRVLDRPRLLKEALADHPNAEEAMRLFSPHVWRQELRSRLQAMGLLSLPKIRIWLLIGVSTTLFLFVFFRLLPSADVQIWPREDVISQTANIFLVQEQQSGATLDIPERVRIMPLIPITVNVTRAITFDQISKEFLGTSAEMSVTIINKAQEPYSLRTGTRLMNQAGMIFKTLEPLNVSPGEEVTLRARADDLDLYGKIIGDRGNVPADVKWEFPGLAPEERVLVYGINRTPARGGTSSFRTVLHQQDLDIAKKRLEEELMATAKQLVDEERIVRNMSRADEGKLEMLYYEELTKTEFKDFLLPTQFLGEPVNSIPVEGSVTYTTYAYDAQAILTMLSEELNAHVGEGKRLLKDTIGLERMNVHVISFDDNLNWIKLTVDLSATEQFILDPLSPTGAKFGKKVREAIAGKTVEEGKRIVKNFPEAEKVDINLWPPWGRSVPHILSHITIAPQN
ncbi:hypothetical protein HYZ99_02600 [Candidatus Peregrinibacteria bacterium]|nr:hypothetical protein [Candidatus Peregrinibacteria bacterium]